MKSSFHYFVEKKNILNHSFNHSGFHSMKEVDNNQVYPFVHLKISNLLENVL